MKIVKGNISCINEISSLFNAYRMFYKQPSDEEGAKKFIQARILNNESHIFIAYVGEKAVGFVQLYPTFSSVSMQRAYILNDLFVDPTCRGKGAGIALMQKAFQFCESEKARFVTLQTAPNNHIAKALYENMGMQIDNEYDSYIKYF
ncbi:GNAT family N-acetyltransferase [Ferdinandcohnia quinoae]|uniref:GNAT family N-acetyltransferase n=1 Tax=Fredinandcohnia quinoae TaxID=2918902 RepID=A0AAW5E5N6_9BACI|nr:GNAT family N-acetyltransferase [Fredinandcohnia sp. SECRCQ15]MCH1625296.1 GNAT family N-acetyltransferase [Fredinandcohnia sp. SECRCQ15]